jgi:hypothetical protein
VKNFISLLKRLPPLCYLGPVAFLRVPGFSQQHESDNQGVVDNFAPAKPGRSAILDLTTGWWLIHICGEHLFVPGNGDLTSVFALRSFNGGA